MNDTNLYTFKLPRRTLADIELLGAEVQKPKGKVEYSLRAGRAWKLIGWILVHVATGQIVVKPYEGLTDREMQALLGGVEDAFRNPPSEATGWARTSSEAEWWQGGTSIAVDPGEAAAAFAAEAERVLQSTPVSTIDVDDPIDLVPTALAWEV